MAYAIMRVQKHNSAAAVAAAENHSIRRREKITTLKHPERSKDNKTLLNRSYGSKSLNVIFNQRAKTLAKKPRKDAVRCVEVMLAFSPGAISEEQVPIWFKANIEFLKGYFGEDNVYKIALHKDEESIHIHGFCGVIHDGKNNANPFVGRDKLSDMQTLYAKAMEPFGLERGINYAEQAKKAREVGEEPMRKPRHKTIKQYHAEQKLKQNSKSIADEVLRG